MVPFRIMGPKRLLHLDPKEPRGLSDWGLIDIRCRHGRRCSAMLPRLVITWNISFERANPWCAPFGPSLEYAREQGAWHCWTASRALSF
jgi:hypothetical protein